MQGAHRKHREGEEKGEGEEEEEEEGEGEGGASGGKTSTESPEHFSRISLFRPCVLSLLSLSQTTHSPASLTQANSHEQEEEEERGSRAESLVEEEEMNPRAIRDRKKHSKENWFFTISSLNKTHADSTMLHTPTLPSLLPLSLSFSPSSSPPPSPAMCARVCLRMREQIEFSMKNPRSSWKIGEVE